MKQIQFQMAFAAARTPDEDPEQHQLLLLANEGLWVLERWQAMRGFRWPRKRVLESKGL